MADEPKKIQVDLTVKDAFQIVRDTTEDIKKSHADDVSGATNNVSTEDMEKVKTMLETLATHIETTHKPLFEQAIETFGQTLTRIANNSTDFFASDEWQRVRDAVNNIVLGLLPLKEQLDEWDRLQPYLQAEITKPEYGGKTLEEIQKEGESDDESNGFVKPGSLFERALIAATAAMEADELKPENVTAKTIIKRADIIEYPLDKINSEIWNLLAEQTTGKQLAFKAEKAGSNKQLNIYYSIDFDSLGDVKISKHLTPFDKRAYIAASALYNAGNSFVTLTQIHYAMGNSTRPNKGQLEKIYDSIRKMNGAMVYVDNTQEAAEYKNYPVFKYSGSLLPIEDIQAIINGQLTDAAIHLFREPPIITFAKQRNQITTINVALLNSPLSKTNENIAIDDYLIERIARAKNGKQPCKILFKTLYEKTNITTSKQKSRAPEKAKRFLEWYKEQGFISGYTIEKDKITVFIPH